MLHSSLNNCLSVLDSLSLDLPWSGASLLCERRMHQIEQQTKPTGEIQCFCVHFFLFFFAYFIRLTLCCYCVYFMRTSVYSVPSSIHSYNDSRIHTRSHMGIPPFHHCDAIVVRSCYFLDHLTISCMWCDGYRQPTQLTYSNLPQLRFDCVSPHDRLYKYYAHNRAKTYTK